MFSSLKCTKCGKLSFTGCGNHLDKIFLGKKASELCQCNEKIVKYIKEKNLK
jgi:hypothetical protein